MELRAKDGGCLPIDRSRADLIGRLDESRTSVRHRPSGTRRGRSHAGTSAGDATGHSGVHHMRGPHRRLNRIGAVSDERWRSLLECTPDLVVVVDSKGLIAHVNHMPAGLTGSREGVVGRSIYDFLTPESRVSVGESIARVFQTGETVRHAVCFSANGSGPAWSQACIGPVTQNGRTVAVGLFCADTAEREKLESRLRESETLLRSIVRVVPRMMEILEGLIRHGAANSGPQRRAQELKLCREQMIQIGRLSAIFTGFK